MDELLARYGVRALRRRCVARGAGEVWRLQPAQGSELALRVYPADRTDPREVETELDWLAALDDAGLHVPRPLADADGRRVQRLGARLAVLVTWLGGRQHVRGLTPARLAQVGRFTGRLHRIAGQLHAAQRVHTRREAFTIDLDDWAAGCRRGSEVLAPAHRRLLAQAATVVRQRLQALRGHQLVHGDLHLWNLLFVRGAAGAIDFGDCGLALPMVDLAATLQYLRHPLAGFHDHRPQYRALHDALLDGYAAEHRLPDGAEAQVDLLLHARLFCTLEWMLDDWSRPDERPWGPAFVRDTRRALEAWLAGATVGA